MNFWLLQDNRLPCPEILIKEELKPSLQYDFQYYSIKMSWGQFILWIRYIGQPLNKQSNKSK